TAKIIADVFDDLEAENCRRLAAKQEPIWPVSLHYFIRNDKKTLRPIPDAVAKRTAAYKAALPGRCQKRTTKTAIESKPAKGDFNTGRCPVDNPLAPGCS
ncbi:MAG TPA: hypothetical protein VGG74_00305, partial [Kofleriaceae bacterium]